MATTKDNMLFVDNVIYKSLLKAYLLDETIEWIKDNLRPEEVFDIEELQEWAYDNGYKTEPD